MTNTWLRNFLDLECFVLSGMTARDTLCAEMAFMFAERNSGRSAIDYPVCCCFFEIIRLTYDIAVARGVM